MFQHKRLSCGISKNNFSKNETFVLKNKKWFMQGIQLILHEFYTFTLQKECIDLQESIRKTELPVPQLQFLLIIMKRRSSFFCIDFLMLQKTVTVSNRRIKSLLYHFRRIEESLNKNQQTFMFIIRIHALFMHLFVCCGDA